MNRYYVRMVNNTSFYNSLIWKGLVMNTTSLFRLKYFLKRYPEMNINVYNILLPGRYYGIFYFSIL